MSYSKYYKEHGPSWLNTSLLEIFKKMDISNTKKYLPIYINFFRSRLDDIEVSYKTEGEFPYLVETVESYIGTEKTNELSFGELLVMYRFVDNMDREKIKTINKFCEFNEKGLLPGLDTTKLTDFTEIESYVANLELKDAEKMFSKQAPKVYEDKNWMVVRPITYESSLKYGATTKWCTASSSNSDHFFRYTKNGALLYILNKSKNYKVALYVPLKGGEGDGPSFWNQVDSRVDSMSLELDYDIMVFLKSQINSLKLCTNDELDSQIWNACFQKHNHFEEKHIEVPTRLIRNTVRMVDVDYPVAEQPVTEDGLIDELFEIDGPAMVSQEQ